MIANGRIRVRQRAGQGRELRSRSRLYAASYVQHTRYKIVGIYAISVRYTRMSTSQERPRVLNVSGRPAPMGHQKPPG